MDLQEAFDAGFDTLKAYVDRSFEAFERRMMFLERRVDTLPAPVDGKDADMNMVRRMIGDEVRGLKDAIEAIPPAPILPDIGKMIDEAIDARFPEDDRSVEDIVRSVVAEMPAPTNGTSVTLDDVLPEIEKSISEKVSALPPAKDGTSVTIDDLAPLIATEVEKRVNGLPKPEDGKSIDPAEVKQMIEDAVAEIPRPENGKDADPEILERMVRDAVAAVPPAEPGKDADPELIKQMVTEAVAQLPPPQDGKDVDMAVVEAKLAVAIENAQARVSEAIAAIPEVKDGVGIATAKINGENDLIITLSDGEIINAGVTCWDGADVDMQEVMLRVNEALAETTSECLRLYAEQVAAIPVPKNGNSVTIEEVRPLIIDEVRSVVGALPKPEPGKDGADVIECFIDKDGQLVATLSNGKIKTVGQVVGRNGDNVDMNEVRSGIQKMVAELPKPKDGEDGLGFEDMTEELEDDGRTIVRRFRRGDVVKEFRHKVKAMVYRGVYKEGQQYSPGDVVTWAGQLSHCDIETTDKPDKVGGEKCWSLIVRRGKDGKDADPKNPTKPGPVKI